jgi:deazaflavin-dependent oxidoreductase (nitroreductase family)
MNNVNDWNAKVIEEFRANGGKVSGRYTNSQLLLLNTIGAKSGEQRTTPLGFLRDGDRVVVAASVLGAPKNPAWYHNLLAHPEVTVELGEEKYHATASVAQGEERERLWTEFLKGYPYLAEHQAKTSRQIPLVILPLRSA